MSDDHNPLVGERDSLVENVGFLLVSCVPRLSFPNVAVCEKGSQARHASQARMGAEIGNLFSV